MINYQHLSPEAFEAVQRARAWYSHSSHYPNGTRFRYGQWFRRYVAPLRFGHRFTTSVARSASVEVG